MKNKTWILLRGLCRESGHWGEFLPLFEKSFLDHNVISLDLPGLGQNIKMKSPSSTEEIVSYLRKTLKEKNINTPIHIFGVSFGAMVAVKWAELFPEEIESFCVANLSDRQSPFFKRLKSKIWGTALRIPLKFSAKSREALILKCISNSPQKSAEALDAWTEIARLRPFRLQVLTAQLLASRSFRAPKILNVDGMIMVSLHDRFVDPTCSFKIGRGLKKKIFTHPWAGHDLTLDDPEWVLQKVHDFIQSSQPLKKIISS